MADYTYDALKRVTLKDYSDPTPDVTYNYDAGSVANWEDQLPSASSGMSTCGYPSYDNAGRVKSSIQIANGVTYTMQ